MPARLGIMFFVHNLLPIPWINLGLLLRLVFSLTTNTVYFSSNFNCRKRGAAMGPTFVRLEVNQVGLPIGLI